MSLPKLPPVKQTDYPLQGGLDLQTPAISVSPGCLFDCQNVEPEIAGGYTVTGQYEASDGRPAPSAAAYWVIAATIVANINVGNTLTGLASTASGYVLGVFGGVIVLTAVTGTYQSGEALQVGGVTKATSTSTAGMNGASLPSDDADYTLLAANYYRTFIQAVPGSGQVRGVKLYKDVVYAFRDNAGATAGDMYKQTAGGWVKIVFGTEIQFTGAVGQIFPGDTITGLTSGATATVTIPMLRSGTWTVAGAGTLIISPLAGVFVSGEALRVGGVTKVTTSSLATAIARLPGGTMEFDVGNFTAASNTAKMYGVDGVNLAFEFDGVNYLPIRTGMAADTPAHVRIHKTLLFLSFLGSVQFSAFGNPYSWSVVTGAGEIGLGDVVTGMIPLAGASSGGSSLGIFTSGKTSMLYGNSAADFQLVAGTYDLGYIARTLQAVANDVYGMTARGVQKLVTTLNYGDFNFAAVSFLVTPIVSAYRGLEVASTTYRYKNQYRLFWSNGYALIIGQTGDAVNGCTLTKYTNVPTCYSTDIKSDGTEVSYFGSTNGFVYQDNKGTSQNGATLEFWIRPQFNNIKSPQVIKRYRRAVFQVKPTGYARINISYDLGYAGMDARASYLRPDTPIIGLGGYWDATTWDTRVWDAPVINTQSIALEGSSQNIAFLFYGNRAQDKPLTIQGVTVLYSDRRIGRMDS